MFAKPYKLKSNNTLKNSEKKHLAQRIQDEYPSATDEKVKEIVSVKSSCICMKLVLHSGDMLNVYSVDGVPMVIETGERLIPTVCALWKVPDLVPVLVIHSPVLPKVQGGAPVYLPGVSIPSCGIGFPMFQRGTVMGMCTQDNAAVCIVGRAAMSSSDMLLRPAGVCLETIQVFGDLLCKDAKFSKIERPKLGPGSYGSGDITINLSCLNLQEPVREEWPSLGQRSLAPQEPPPKQNEPKVIPEPEDNEQKPDEEPDSNVSMLTDDSQIEEYDIPTDMDGLLRWCLLSFLKLDAKNVELPLKTNLLYRNHLIALCPPDQNLEVKKSSYKKLGKFLEEMQKEGLLEVREIDKGVDAVVAVNLAHPQLRSHALPAALRAALRLRMREAPAPPDYVPPQVREMFCITAHVADVFAPLKKGTALSPADTRARLTEYVRTHALSSAQVKGAVTMDATLAKITGKPEQEAVKWDVLMSLVQGRMTPSTEMRFADGSVRLSKTRLEPIRMQVATRSGNKKVTLVSNLEQFGFSLAALGAAWQAGAAAACAVTRAPGARADQLMLQGDQTYFVAKLLIEKYGLPKKFVEGADKALNKKK
uniref:SUI1 domain-containing protein n=1 Tax=Heliothis virescens TaxID=7102 RepID=A0A2A4K3D8_HELVI